MFRLIMLCVAGLGFVGCTPAAAENWPSWRGPRGDGSSLDEQVPVHFDLSTGENLVWKVKVPGSGHASPIVWGDRLFISTCFEAEQQRAVVCLDTESGDVLWRADVLTSPLETVHAFNSYASGTPATDGQLVFAAFLKVDGEPIEAPNVGESRKIMPGRIIVTALDFEGQQRWQVDVGEFISAHGFCSSPVIYKNLVIINGDHDGNSYLVALNKSTGEEVWRVQREQGIRSYVTPIIRAIEGQDQLVLSGSGHVASFRPEDGKMIWKVEGPTEQFVASMVFDGQRFILAAGFPTHHVMAIRPDGRGDVTDSHIAWHVDQYVRCYVPSPVLVDQQLFVADDRGTASGFDSRDGTRIWQGRLAGSYNASLVATQRAVYFLSGDGVMKVVEPGPALKIIAESRLEESCHASPAISNGQLYIRGEEYLYRIGTRPSLAGGLLDE